MADMAKYGGISAKEAKASEEFRHRSQEENESVEEFGRALERLASDCNFSSESEILKQFLLGLRSITIRERLSLVIKHLPFEQALRLAHSIEKDMQHNETPPTHSIPYPEKEIEKPTNGPKRRGKRNIVMKGKIKAEALVVGSTKAVIHNDHQSGNPLPEIKMPDRSSAQPVDRKVTMGGDVDAKQVFVDADDLTLVNNATTDRPLTD